MIVIAISIQTTLNIVSTRKGYGLSKPVQVAAVILNVTLLVAYEQRFGFSINILLLSLASCILISTFFVDFKHYIIPNGYNLTLFLIAIAFVLNNLEYWQTHVKGGVFFFLSFLVLLMISGGNLGAGDVKMSVSLGLFLGSSAFMNYMVVTFLSCALASICLLILKLKKKEDKIAFGPYMIMGFIWLLPW
ncbi:A24 family peptidase (plasmid) [Paenibacillus thiaminolyticus]|uniref:prepilin peptidase n=1 Tax=Paenibacillus thiaminolyticus TaxID=49283 RepID=UPI0023312D26|nr:A24 family peptidase [Paenibacillus thiaminolyticus]WCF11404.1 A24 family peptidase [Paenibacillus thiaminolyticus]